MLDKFLISWYQYKREKTIIKIMASKFIEEEESKRLDINVCNTEPLQPPVLTDVSSTCVPMTLKTEEEILEHLKKHFTPHFLPK